MRLRNFVRKPFVASCQTFFPKRRSSPVIWSSVAASAAFHPLQVVPTEASPPSPNCLNCGTTLAGPYCHNCGQHDAVARKDAGFVGEAVEEFTNYDSKIFRTLGKLLWRPGRLSLDYVQGRRASMVPPLRLFINVSVVVLLLMALSWKQSLLIQSDGKDVSNQSLDSIGRAANKEALKKARAKNDTAMVRMLERTQDEATKPVSTGVTDEADWDDELQDKLSEKAKKATPGQILDTFMQHLPTAMFVLMPLAALLHWLFFWRQHRHYVRHLVFNLHVHTFAFLLLIPIMLLGLITYKPLEEPISILSGIIGFAIPVYYVIATRRFYAQGWGWIAAKTAAVSLLYIVLLMFMLTGLILASIYLQPS